MSSYVGTNLNNAQGSEPGLQLAPKGNSGPDHGLLTKSFQDTIANLQGFVDQQRENFNTRYALWTGQSADGRKHRREGAKIDPTPWDGASDLQVFLVDEAINSKVAMLSMAFRRAGISATPVEGNDIKRARTVSNFMRWLIQTQIPEVAREVKLLCNYFEENGIGAIGSFWEETQDKILVTVTLDQLQQKFPTVNMQEAIFSDDMADAMIANFEEVYGCSKSKAKKMLSELRMDQKTSVPTLGKVKSHPVIRAFNLHQNLFIPNFSTDLEHAQAVFRVEYYSAEQLRSFANTSGWDSAWCEAAIERCRGQLISLTQTEYNQPIARSFQYQEQRFTDLIGVVFAYQRLSDEDGNTGIYLTIFNPQLPPDETQDGYAKFGLLGYAHGQYPFVLFRREYLSRKLHDTRGIPEPGKPLQQQIKVHKDSLIDAASMAICPPMMFPHGRPPLRWGAGARIPERRTGEYHFADFPRYDPSTAASEAQLQADFNRYNGFVSAETDPTYAGMKSQDEVDEFLTAWTKVFQQIWSLYKQYGQEQVFFRVSGLRETDPIEFHKGEDGEEFDFMLKFGLDSMDSETTFQKLEQIAKVIATADRDGVIDYTAWLTVMIEAIDPVMAEKIISPKEQGQNRVVSQMQELLAKVFAGQEHDIQLGTPPDLGLSVIQNYIQGDPVVQKRMQDKSDPFASRIEKLAKQLNFQRTQQQNAQIGRLGA